jgi:putative protein kinase ArgK-like GTPase of G3E family
MVDAFLLWRWREQGINCGASRRHPGLADVIAVNKADGDHAPEARQAARSYQRHCIVAGRE